MTDREKLVELIGSTEYGNGSLVGKNFQEGFIEKIAEHLLANGVTVQDWVSVSERLPDFGSRVIACGEKGGVFVVKSEGKTTGFGRMDGASKYRSFTHWMPLPQPPKEGE